MAIFFYFFFFYKEATESMLRRGGGKLFHSTGLESAIPWKSQKTTISVSKNPVLRARVKKLDNISGGLSS